MIRFSAYSHLVPQGRMVIRNRALIRDRALIPFFETQQKLINKYLMFICKGTRRLESGFVVLGSFLTRTIKQSSQNFKIFR